MSAGSPRAASRDSLHSHPASSKKPVFFYCLESVVGATRSESARRWFPRGTALITPDHEDAEASSHTFNTNFARSALSVAKSASFALIPITTTQS